MTTSLREKVDEITATLKLNEVDAHDFYWAVRKLDDCGLLKWVAEQAVSNAPATGYPDTQNNAYWDEDWWKTFTEGL